MRTNSVLSYILLGLERAGWDINRIETLKGDADKSIDNPAELNNDPLFGVKFDKTRVDQMILEDQLEYTLQDNGIKVQTDQGNLTIEFNPERFRPARFHWYSVITAKSRRLVGRLSTVSVISSKNSWNILTKKRIVLKKTFPKDKSQRE